MQGAIGHFEQAVLLSVIHLRADAYGRAILVEVGRRLARDVSAGAVYATLDRLESKGFVTSQLEPGTAIRGGRARRYFTPSAAGVDALNTARAAAEALWGGLAWPLQSTL
jgi:DNA-binding PadR family transcriptional regulator